MTDRTFEIVETKEGKPHGGINGNRIRLFPAWRVVETTGGKTRLIDRTFVQANAERKLAFMQTAFGGR